MEKKDCGNHYRFTVDYYTQNEEMRKNLVTRMFEMLKLHDNLFELPVENEFDEEELLLVSLMEEFGYTSHTYVVEKVELAEKSNIVIRIARYDHKGFGHYRTISPWYLSVDDLIRVYQGMVNVVEMELYKEEEVSNEEK